MVGKGYNKDLFGDIRREDWRQLKPTLYGWGINDVNYRVQIKIDLPKLNSKRVRKAVWVCPYYDDWVKLMSRSYSKKLHIENPTYKTCIVSEDWKYLSNFIKWVDSQPNRDWQNCDLDKDLLGGKNKSYSPETCCYVNKKINTFILDRKSSRGEFLIGVSYCTRSKKNPYQSHCGNTLIKNGSTYLGSFPTELEAHKAWQVKKHEYACLLAEEQSDPRVAKALRERYAPDKDWTNR